MPETCPRHPPPDLKQLLSDMLRLLTFRLSTERLNGLTLRHLCLGLFVTWLVGMGRYWDDPDAHLGQHLGLGSLAYVFVLGGILWLAFKPIAPRRVSYLGVVKFVSLTAAPAMLYAIPVERFLSLGAAVSVNVWFLAAVASWRVALLAFFMLRALAFRWYEALFAGLLPLTGIVVTLTILNLERAVFEIMGGLGPAAQTANDGAYRVLFSLSFLAVNAAPLLVVGYLACVAHRIIRRRKSPDPQSSALLSATLHSNTSNENTAPAAAERDSA